MFGLLCCQVQFFGHTSSTLAVVPKHLQHLFDILIQQHFVLLVDVLVLDAASTSTSYVMAHLLGNR